MERQESSSWKRAAVTNVSPRQARYRRLFCILGDRRAVLPFPLFFQSSSVLDYWFIRADALGQCRPLSRQTRLLWCVKNLFSTPRLTSPAMRCRKLRIAWSVFWGLACVLLIVFWLRNSKQDVRGPRPGRNFYMSVVDTPLNSLMSHYATSQGLQLDTSSLSPETVAEPIALEYRGDEKGFLQLLHDKTELYFSVSNGSGAPVLSITTQPYLPHRRLLYSAVITSIALAAAPWLPRSFSLRTLLIATTLVAMVLGFGIWAVNR
jgi:hypothetical protein